eukprot:2128828-Alexandrium_andersonii.AAC.1
MLGGGFLEEALVCDQVDLYAFPSESLLACLGVLMQDGGLVLGAVDAAPAPDCGSGLHSPPE